MNFKSDLPILEIWTEGKTDWMHLEAASHNLGINPPINFNKSEKGNGSKERLRECEIFARKTNQSPILFVFDGDEPDVLKKVTDPNNPFKSWGNNVYSMSIPKPKSRKGHKFFCIEFLYSDSEIKTPDQNGRRLFLTSEFNKISGKLIKNKLVSIKNAGNLKNFCTEETSKIIDADVFNDQDQNIALPKAKFASYVYHNISPFDQFDFKNFKPIFDVITQIVSISGTENSVYLPDFKHLFDQISTQNLSRQLSISFNLLRRVSALALQIFSITTIRCYEDEIVNENERYKKKAKAIKEVLRDKYFSPTLETNRLLAEKCYYIIDDNAPFVLHKMKDSLGEAIVLDNLGQVLDDLEKIFPPKRGTPIKVNKPQIQRDLLKFFISELAKYDRKTLIEVEEEANYLLETQEILIENWQKSLLQIVEVFSPILNNSIVLRSLNTLDSHSGEYSVEIKTFENSSLNISHEKISKDQAEDYQAHYSQIQLDESNLINTFPMLLIENNALYFYQRSRASGYEYLSLANGNIHIESTKKKFNHSIFVTGSSQEFFWTEVIPITNKQNGVRANIPQEGLDDFVGRTRQKRLIREEILEIPNQHGIIYGPGGIGKTALMQQITQELFDEPDPDNILFDNIIWVSAKRDYYDYISGTTEDKPQRSESLEDVLTAILQFFEFGELYEFNDDDKKELTLEVLSENRTLLILDNFETIQEVETKKIIRFFGTEAKKFLRSKPDFFKVVITSRKQIPCGFHQLKLKGLDLRESRKVMRILTERYNSKHLLDKKKEKEIHDATQGIPIVIKHCFGQIFEYNVPLQAILRKLQRYDSQIIKFSHKEILNQVETKNKNGTQLKILLLLEMLGYPLAIGQLATFINTDEQDIEDNLPTLVNFQCLEYVYSDGSDKYVLNDEIRLLTKSLSQKYIDINRNLRAEILNKSVKNLFGATEDESHMAMIFEEFISQRHWVDAEKFIDEQLKRMPNSVILNFHYARYLANHKREYEDAINYLERVREPSNNHHAILSLLVFCHTSLEIPQYNSVDSYIKELEHWGETDYLIRIQVSQFYVEWALSIKAKKEQSFLHDASRQKRYKSLADQALHFLLDTPKSIRDDKHYYLLAECNYIKWDYDRALFMINKAEQLSDTPQVYSRTRYKIERAQRKYAK